MKDREVTVMRTARKTTCVVCLAFVMVVVGAVGASDWATWRGPNANGVSHETGWNPRALAKANPVSWKTNVGKGHSTVAVVGNRLYTLGSQLRNNKVVAEVVYCLDSTTGRKVWDYAYPATHREFPGPGSTPVVDGDLVFTLGRDGMVHAFNAANGSVMWRRDLATEGLARPEHWGFNGSPLVHGDRLILNASSAGLALHKRNGKVIWSSEPGQNGHATPVLFQMGDEELVAILTRRGLSAVNPETGELRWTHAWRGDRDPDPAEVGLLLTGGRGGSSLLDRADAEPQEVWQARTFRGEFMTGVVVNGHAFGFGRDGRAQPLQCVDMSTGELAWSQDLGTYGSLIAAGGNLIIIDGDGDLIIAEASGAAYKELSRTRVFPEIKRYESYPENDHNACWTAPVIADGRIYVRSAWGEIACVDVRG